MSLAALRADWTAKKQLAIQHGHSIPNYEWAEAVLAEADHLAAENATLREALQPFAAIIFDDTSPIGYRATFRPEDVDGARAVLAE